MIRFIGEKFAELFLSFINIFWGPADEFKSPLFLLFLLAIPVWLFWYVWWYSPRRLIVPLSYDPRKMVEKKRDLGWMRVIPQILMVSGIFFAILALARPISAFETEDQYSEGIDIMLLMDVSGSMETDDFKPNRLEVAKETAINFVDGRLDDRIGVTVFAEDAFLYVPLTLDYSFLKKQIETLNSDIMPKQGTAMGSAIGISIYGMAESKSPSKVFILLTDGASNRGQIDPITAAKLARENRIKIYCIGIGKEEYVHQSVFGSQTIKSELDEPTMKKVAEITGGQFFRSTDENSLQEIFDTISSMEKIEIKEERYREEKDVYPGILAFAGILIGLSFLGMVTFAHNPLEG